MDRYGIMKAQISSSIERNSHPNLTLQVSFWDLVSAASTCLCLAWLLSCFSHTLPRNLLRPCPLYIYADSLYHLAQTRGVTWDWNAIGRWDSKYKHWGSQGQAKVVGYLTSPLSEKPGLRKVSEGVVSMLRKSQKLAELEAMFSKQRK